MKPLHCVAFAICGLAACGLPPPAGHPTGERATDGPLCELLERVGVGDKLPATISGIYTVDYEYNRLYDPRHPRCRLDVESGPTVRFERSVRRDPGFKKALEEDYRVYVKVRGVLWGPPAPALAADDPSLPELVAFSRRVAGCYGHLCNSRTEFVVNKLLEWRRVPRDVPDLVDLLKLPKNTVPEVAAAAIPVYPRKALRAHITGTVVVDVEVRKGKVTHTEVTSVVDRELDPYVVENIETWKFKDDVDTTFKTTYSFMLELRERGSDQNPRIELHLPLSVKITAPWDERW